MPVPGQTWSKRTVSSDKPAEDTWTSPNGEQHTESAQQGK